MKSRLGMKLRDKQLHPPERHLKQNTVLFSTADSSIWSKEMIYIPFLPWMSNYLGVDIL